MGINRVQFQKGLSMVEFMERYGTEGQRHAAVVALRWPDRLRLPRVWRDAPLQIRAQGAVLCWQCASCRAQTTVMCGTIFESTKLSLTTWFLAMHLLTQAKNNVSALELKRRLGVRYKTAWLLKHKLMQVMSEREMDRQLEGPLETDDAYLGGELSGGKSGRGSENNVPFIAAVQTTDSKSSGTETSHSLEVCLKKLEFTKEAMAVWAKTTLAASAYGVSDGLWCFQAVTVAGATHDERTVTGGGPACVKLEQFRAVNTFLGNLNTAYLGTYRTIDFAKYAHRYPAEVQYRFNLSSVPKPLLVAAVATSPRPGRFLRVAEHCA